MSKIYTGRRVAIFTDAHGLLEPVQAALKDMQERGINEVYSLGDNIGDGLDSSGVISTLQQYGVKSIAGNAEEYITLGIQPFISYMAGRVSSVERTRSQLSQEQIQFIASMPHSFEILLGGKKIGLCHFGNDVRIDYGSRSTWSYQGHFDLYGTGERKEGHEDASRQFEYTGCSYQLEQILKYGTGYGSEHPAQGGFVSAYNDPMFPKVDNPHEGQQLDAFTDIFQGHVHFKLYDPGNTNFHTLRAVGMAYRSDPINTASYVILSEYVDPETGEKGFDTEEVLVEYDRDKMIYKILNSELDTSKLQKFTSVTDEERTRLRR